MSGASIAVDLALVRNSTAFVCAYPGPVVRIGEILELKPKKGAPLKLSEVIATGCDFAERHGSHNIFGDHHELHAAREHLRKGFFLEAVEGGALARMKRFLAVRSLLVEGKIQIPRVYSRLGAQLRDAISKPGPGGIVNVILRSRGAAHSDVAAAFTLAVWIASGSGRRALPPEAWDEAAAAKMAPPLADAAINLSGVAVGSSSLSAQRESGFFISSRDHLEHSDAQDRGGRGGSGGPGSGGGWPFF